MPVFFLNVIFGVAVFLLFVFALVVLSRVIILTKQMESVKKVILDADKKLDDIKNQFDEMPNRSADEKKE